MDSKDAHNTASLERYVAIIDLFAGIHRGTEMEAIAAGGNAFGVAEISNAMGISKGTVSRYLRRLERAGLLNRRADRRYTLSTRVYYWGQAARPGGDIRAASRPIMEGLALEFGEPVSLFVLESGVAVCIDQVEGIHPVRLNAAVGRQLPLHTGSSPRLLLAFAGRPLQEEVLSRAPYPASARSTITTAADLAAELEATQKRGYVLSISESNDDVVGIAAPIRDVSNHVVAALSIAGPVDRIVGERRDQCLAGVRAAANAISKEMGFLHLDDASDPGEPPTLEPSE